MEAKRVSAAAGAGPSDLIQPFSPSFRTVTGLNLPAPQSTWVPHAVGLAMSYQDDERDAKGGTPHSVTSTSSSGSSFANIDYSQEMLDEVSRQKVLLKKHKLE